MPATALSALTVLARLILTTNEAGRHDFPPFFLQTKQKQKTAVPRGKETWQGQGHISRKW